MNSGYQINLRQLERFFRLTPYLLLPSLRFPLQVGYKYQRHKSSKCRRIYYSCCVYNARYEIQKENE